MFCAVGVLLNIIVKHMNYKEMKNLIETYGFKNKLSGYKIRIYKGKEQRWFDYYFTSGKVSQYYRQRFSKFGDYQDLEDLLLKLKTL